MDDVLPKGREAELMPVLTDWLRSVSDMTKAAGVVLGVRVWPTEAMNLERGLDVRTWVEEGLVDYLLPYVYGGFVTDSQPPIQWLVDAAADSKTPRFLSIRSRLPSRSPDMLSMPSGGQRVRLLRADARRGAAHLVRDDARMRR